MRVKQQCEIAHEHDAHCTRTTRSITQHVRIAHSVYAQYGVGDSAQRVHVARQAHEAQRVRVAQSMYTAQSVYVAYSMCVLHSVRT
jgi:hypothetical protein